MHVALPKGEYRVQIFVVETQPGDAARALCDKHVISQIGETAELLAIAHVLNGEGVPPMAVLRPRTRHLHHPCAKWVGATLGNYRWTHQLAKALLREYTHRYGRYHVYESDIVRMTHAPFKLRADKAPKVGHVAVMPDEFVDPTSVLKSYRNYYHHKAEKMKMRWTNRLSPRWFTAVEHPTYATTPVEARARRVLS